MHLVQNMDVEVGCGGVARVPDYADNGGLVGAVAVLDPDRIRLEMGVERHAAGVQLDHHVVPYVRAYVRDAVVAHGRTKEEAGIGPEGDGARCSAGWSVRCAIACYDHRAGPGPVDRPTPAVVQRRVDAPKPPTQPACCRRVSIWAGQTHEIESQRVMAGRSLGNAHSAHRKVQDGRPCARLHCGRHDSCRVRPQQRGAFRFGALAGH